MRSHAFFDLLLEVIGAQSSLWLNLKSSKCCPLAQLVGLWNSTRILAREHFHWPGVPDTSCSLLCSTTGWTVNWASVGFWLVTRMDSVSGSIYAMKDEVYVGTPTAVRILDILEPVDDCTGDAWTHYRLSFGMECQVSFPRKAVVQAHRAMIGSSCEAV